MSADRISRGELTFDDATPPAFVDLVEQTLDQSDHIATTRTTTDDHDGEVLTVDERITEPEPDTVEVTFHPQVWSDGRAYTSDDTIQFTIPESDATDRAGELLEDCCAASDPLKHHANAPPSVQHYPGPYSQILRLYSYKPPIFQHLSCGRESIGARVNFNTGTE
jgi:hypothetical protein